MKDFVFDELRNNIIWVLFSDWWHDAVISDCSTYLTSYEPGSFVSAGLTEKTLELHSGENLLF